MVKCVKSGKRRSICNCGDEKCGGCLCKKSGKEKVVCNCGNSFCIHGKRECRICDMTNYLISRCRSRINKAVKNKRMKSIDYLGCDIEIQFKEGMNWDNYGE